MANCTHGLFETFFAAGYDRNAAFRPGGTEVPPGMVLGIRSPSGLRVLLIGTFRGVCQVEEKPGKFYDVVPPVGFKAGSDITLKKLLVSPGAAQIFL